MELEELRIWLRGILYIWMKQCLQNVFEYVFLFESNKRVGMECLEWYVCIIKKKSLLAGWMKVGNLPTPGDNALMDTVGIKNIF